MSVEAITWALAQRVDRSSAKFVLVAMANCAGPDMVCWPSVAYLVEATCQDRKTVLENMKRLREAGFIVPTNEHRGRTGQVAVYRLTSPENGTVKEAQKRDVPKTVPVPKTDSKSPVFPTKESRFSVETVPFSGHGTVNEPSIEPSGNQKRKSPPVVVGVAALVEAGFETQAAEDFIAHKSAVKAPLTERAWKDHLRESAKAGWTPAEAAEKVMARNWKGFEAKYVASEARQGGPPVVSKQAALEARNRAVIDEYMRENLL